MTTTLNELIAPKHIMDSIPVTPWPLECAPTLSLATFGYDGDGKPVGWRIEEGRDLRDDPDYPALIGTTGYGPDLDSVKTLSKRYPCDCIVVEWYDLFNSSYGDFCGGRAEFINGEIVNMPTPERAIRGMGANPPTPIQMFD